MSRPEAGRIVLVDWRDSQRLPGEPGGIRPAVVIERSGVLTGTEQNLLVVPLSTREIYAQVPVMAQRIEPTEENGCTAISFALAQNVGAVALARCHPTASRVTDGQVRLIRDKSAYLIGVGADEDDDGGESVPDLG